MKCLGKYKSNMHEEGRLLMESIKTRGYQAVLNNIPSRVDIPIDQICEYLTDTLNMNSSHPQS
jgi:hypothetical protein